MQGGRRGAGGWVGVGGCSGAPACVTGAGRSTAWRPGGVGGMRGISMHTQAGTQAPHGQRHHHHWWRRAVRVLTRSSENPRQFPENPRPHLSLPWGSQMMSHPCREAAGGAASENSQPDIQPVWKHSGQLRAGGGPGWMRRSSRDSGSAPCRCRWCAARPLAAPGPRPAAPSVSACRRCCHSQSCSSGAH